MEYMFVGNQAGRQGRTASKLLMNRSAAERVRMEKNCAPIRLAPGEPELAAELEVTKTIAFFALMAGLRALQGDTKVRIENFEQSIKSFFTSCNVDLPDVELARYRRHALTIVDDLLRRIDLDEGPYKS